jgi:teichuronic acid biosynthesis glycosyltransferase TuaG
MREAASSPADDGAFRVSVVMPVFNAEKTLAQAIDSVLAQTRPVHELIVVDDCSSDGSPAMIEAYARRDPRVKPIRQPANAGVAQARNAGIDAATGTHIAFLDSDDWWAPSKLEVQIAEMRRTGAKVCYAAYQRVDEAGKPLSMVRPPAAVSYTDLLKSNYIGHLTGIYDRSVGDVRFRRIGHEDYAFWLDIVRASGGAVCAPHPGPLAFYTVRQGSVSANKVRAAGWQWRIYRDVAHLDVFAATRYMLHYVFHALAKRRSGVT